MGCIYVVFPTRLDLTFPQHRRHVGSGNMNPEPVDVGHLLQVTLTSKLPCELV